MSDVLRAAVVGAGPSGFYATDQLLRAGFDVDLLELLPTPFGLVRAGVAPDHPKIKSVTRMYEKTAKHEQFRFFGGVELGTHVGRAGAARALPRGALRGRHVVRQPARDPGRGPAGLAPRHGVRGLVQRPPGLRRARVRPRRHPRRRGGQRQRRGRCRPHARARARRGGGHGHRRPRGRAAGRRPGARRDRARAPRPGSGGVHHPGAARARRADARRHRDRPGGHGARPGQRGLAGLRRGRHDGAAQRRAAARVLPAASRTATRAGWSCASCARPWRSSARARTARSPACASARNRIEAAADGRLRAVPDAARRRSSPAGSCCARSATAASRSPGIPFDERRGLIRNAGGRVVGEDGARQRGEYVVGWVKRGPSGVIGTNKKDAADTVARILEDREAGALNAPADAGPEACAEWLAEQCPHLITWEGWRAIDEHETGAGALAGPAAGQARAHRRDVRRGQRRTPAPLSEARRRRERRAGAGDGTPPRPGPSRPRDGIRRALRPPWAGVRTSCDGCRMDPPVKL